MPAVTMEGVTIAYDTVGEGEPVVLVCGCGQPAVAWHLSLVPALSAAGYQVVTFDNRGAVSYTHLDVYKRQLEQRTGG